MTRWRSDTDDAPTGACEYCGDPVYDGDDICQSCADYFDDEEEEEMGDE